MPINITMPALSPTMEKGDLVKWLVKEGDKVTSGDIIAEIETDKAVMEVEAVDEGIVAKLVIPAGTKGVKVNALIAVLAGEGEDISTIAQSGGTVPINTDSLKSAPAVIASEPQKLEKAKATSIPLQQMSDRNGDDKRIVSSPLARRLAREAGIHLETIIGSGPHGRVVKKDLEAEISASRTQIGSISDDGLFKLFEEGSYELVPHDGMRKTIARRLLESKLTVPHFYLTIDCEIDALIALRTQVNAVASIRKTNADIMPDKISVNDLIIKATALALRDIPEANVSWTENGMMKHKHCDIGVAVSIPGGLMTPIIRHAEEKTLFIISNEMKDLAKRARERKLKPEEYQGGTTSISNLGMFGVKDFAAIINPPHATIFAIGAGNERVISKNGKISVANIMSVTLSSDHRAVDGALAAELAQAFKRYIENPIAMLI